MYIYRKSNRSNTVHSRRQYSKNPLQKERRRFGLSIFDQERFNSLQHRSIDAGKCQLGKSKPIVEGVDRRCYVGQDLIHRVSFVHQTRFTFFLEEKVWSRVERRLALTSNSWKITLPQSSLDFFYLSSIQGSSIISLIEFYQYVFLLPR